MVPLKLLVTRRLSSYKPVDFYGRSKIRPASEHQWTYVKRIPMARVRFPKVHGLRTKEPREVPYITSTTPHPL